MNLYIYCAGGLGKETFDVAEKANLNKFKYDDIFFIDDAPSSSALRSNYSKKVIPFKKISHLITKEDRVVIANGEPSIRKKLYEKLKFNGIKTTKIFADNAFISPTSKISSGAIIAPFCSIQSEAKINLNVAINTMSIVAHDVVIGNHTVISSMVNLGGNVKIGSSSYVGMGAQIKQGVKIGSNTIIGMGSVVYNDIPNNVIALGNPARVSRKNINNKVF